MASHLCIVRAVHVGQRHLVRVYCILLQGGHRRHAGGGGELCQTCLAPTARPRRRAAGTFRVSSEVAFMWSRVCSTVSRRRRMMTAPSMLQKDGRNRCTPCMLSITFQPAAWRHCVARVVACAVNDAATYVTAWAVTNPAPPRGITAELCGA